jgi:hypothetical protein
MVFNNAIGRRPIGLAGPPVSQKKWPRLEGPGPVLLKLTLRRGQCQASVKAALQFSKKKWPKALPGPSLGGSTQQEVTAVTMTGVCEACATKRVIADGCCRNATSAYV